MVSVLQTFIRILIAGFVCVSVEVETSISSGECKLPFPRRDQRPALLIIRTLLPRLKPLSRLRCVCRPAIQVLPLRLISWAVHRFMAVFYWIHWKRTGALNESHMQHILQGSQTVCDLCFCKGTKSCMTHSTESP